MTTAILVLLLVALAVGFAWSGPGGSLAGTPPVDRDHERQIDELRARR